MYLSDVFKRTKTFQHAIKKCFLQIVWNLLSISFCLAKKIAQLLSEWKYKLQMHCCWSDGKKRDPFFTKRVRNAAKKPKITYFWMFFDRNQSSNCQSNGFFMVNVYKFAIPAGRFATRLNPCNLWKHKNFVLQYLQCDNFFKWLKWVKTKQERLRVIEKLSCFEITAFFPTPIKCVKKWGRFIIM